MRVKDPKKEAEPSNKLKEEVSDLKKENKRLQNDIDKYYNRIQDHQNNS